ncbi:MAG: glutamate--tRNA ligase [Alphaproteobacteria bacterium]|nr:glutamate--tRNA ligase [Alphaproteobacteria bacterium]
MTRVRFAPSPTGRLHVGNIRPALMNWLFALKRGGVFILRFDDTDAARSTRAFADGIEEDLRWLGIEPDLIVRQSERSATHDAARDRLIAAGRLYPCYETPDELERRRRRALAQKKPPIYDRAALELTDKDRAHFEAEGRRAHWRFRLDGRPVAFTDLIRGPQIINTASMSDPVLVREDGSYLYTLPSVADDIDLGITHVIRGEDHVSNTGAQIELFEALGAEPPVFAHHNLLTDEDGQGLSKRLGSASVADFRLQGYEPLAVAIEAVLTGTSLPVAPYPSLAAISEDFEFSAVSHGAARFSESELDGLNARMLHAMAFEDVAPRLETLGLSEPALWEALRENLTRFADIADWARLVTGPVQPVIEDSDAGFLVEAAALLPAEPWDEDTWRTWTEALKQKSGRKGRALFHPLRLALTGRGDGPELRILLPLIGRRACLDRLAGRPGRRT